MTSGHRIIQQAFKVIIFAAFLFGCAKPSASPSSDQMDNSPFTGIPCVAPCWQGLLIGKSSETDVMSTLPTLTYINPDSIQLFRMGSAPGLNPKDYEYEAEIVANCKSPEKQCLALRTKNYILTEIELIFNYEMTVDEAMGYLGNPDFIGYGNLGAERIICEVYLVWSDKQLVLASEKFEGSKAFENNCGVVGDTGKVESNLIISEARYMSVKGIEFMLSRGYNFTLEFSGTIPEK
jgi:hypothetical protein